MIALAFVIAPAASANIIVSLSPGGGGNVDLGVAGAGKRIDFFIGQVPGTSPTVAAAVVTFNLEAGVVEGETRPFPATSDNGTGTVSAVGFAGTPGFFAAGNLRTSTISKESDTSFLINQFYDNLAQPFTDATSPELWFSLNLDTTGLAAGDYAITLANPNDSFRDLTTQSIPVQSNLSFTVSAIPEPALLPALTLFSLVGLSRRRRRQASI